jgi:hypothetical protein
MVDIPMVVFAEDVRVSNEPMFQVIDFFSSPEYDEFREIGGRGGIQHAGK